jgi:Protein of unknown function (DUF3618)
MNAAAGTGGPRRNPADLERDSDAIRADMDRTIEALESKFSPREVVDRSLDYVREHGAEIVERVGETVRSNPIPIAMTAAGLVWLAASVVRQQNEFISETDEESRFHDADEFGPDDQWESDRDESSDTERSGNEASDDPRIVSHRLARSAKAVRRQVGEARRSAAQSVAEQPLFWGVLALAAGALLGSALPATEYEKQVLSRRTGAAGHPAPSMQDAGPIDKESVTYGA